MRENHTQLLLDTVFAVCFMSFLGKKKKSYCSYWVFHLSHSLLIYSSREFPHWLFPYGSLKLPISGFFLVLLPPWFPLLQIKHISMGMGEFLSSTFSFNTIFGQYQYIALCCHKNMEFSRIFVSPHNWFHTFPYSKEIFQAGINLFDVWVIFFFLLLLFKIHYGEW